ncbi:MAG TPA: hypothetical protein VN514_03980 [Ignavibacteria bacterium]|nr:hypothetical protein [Ignavibacteria bacterium]
MVFIEFLLPLITQILRINSKSVHRKDAKDTKKEKRFLEFPRDYAKRADCAGLRTRTLTTKSRRDDNILGQGK